MTAAIPPQCSRLQPELPRTARPPMGEEPGAEGGSARFIGRCGRAEQRCHTHPLASSFSPARPGNVLASALFTQRLGTCELPSHFPFTPPSPSRLPNPPNLPRASAEGDKPRHRFLTFAFYSRNASESSKHG